jgi:hypothetical protein
MAERSFSDDLGKEMAGKAVMWGPAVAGAVLFGPMGLALGLATSVVLAVSGNSSDLPANGEQAEK